ncbi:hypothetical protein [Catellatospora sichuanensis]|uniref:hypothetical protein n=1 Tax=Catellatospora sichuanensis TaxID=1969805 RepID=UPI001181D270|nr:hypothetical protein [Catellatospora sichuanensis]
MSTVRRPRASLALSAVSFGMLGWAGAHAAVDLLLAHEHGGARHIHGYLPSVIVAAAALGVASLLAVFLAALAPARPGKPASGRRRRHADMRVAAALSPLAYVAAEYAEHITAGGHQLPPPVVAAVGLATYLFIGVGISLLWRSSVTAVQRAARRLSAPDTTTIPAWRPHRGLTTVAAPATLHWPHACAGRGPPAPPA